MAFKKLMCFFTLLFSLPALAQTIEKKNEIKLNFSSVAFKGFNVQYERQVAEKITVALSYGMVPNSSIPYKSYIEKQIFIPDVNIGDFSLGTHIFTPEARYYFGEKGAFHGFYLASYARIGNYKIKGPIAYSNNGTKDYAEFAGRLTTITGGIMAGSSWQLSEKFYIDWWIAGVSFGGESGRLANTSRLSESDQASLKRKIESISISYTKLTSDVNSNGAIVNTSGSIVGLRGLGINLGIRF